MSVVRGQHAGFAFPDSASQKAFDKALEGVQERLRKDRIEVMALKEVAAKREKEVWQHKLSLVETIDIQKLKGAQGDKNEQKQELYKIMALAGLDLDEL